MKNVKFDNQSLTPYLYAVSLPVLAGFLSFLSGVWIGETGLDFWHFFSVFIVCWKGNLKASLFSVFLSLIIVNVIASSAPLPAVPVPYDHLYRSCFFTLLGVGIAFIGSHARCAAIAADQARKEMERQLVVSREREVRHTTILDNVGEYGIIMLDPNGMVISWNHGAEEIKGFTADEIVGHHYTSLREKAGGTNLLAEAMEKGRVVIEEVHRRKDGGTFIAHVVTSAVREEDRLLGFVQIVNDVTGERRKEQDLRYQLQLNETITRSAIDPLFMLDALGRITFMNPAAEALFGYTQDDLLGKALYDTLHRENAEGEPFTKDTCPFVVGQHTCTSIRGYETYFTNKNGEPVPVECSGVPIMHEGRSTGVVMIAHNITEQRLSERELRDARIRLNAALDAGNIGTWTWDVEHDLLRGDCNLAKMFGLAVADCEKGLPVSIYFSAVHEEDRERVRQLLDEAIDSAATYEASYRVTDSEGKVHWVTARGSIERDESQKAVYVPGVVLDMTSQKEYEDKLRKAKEDAEAANKAKDNFIAALSHELRTPLTPVLAAIDGMLRFNTIPENLKDEVWMLRRNVELEIGLIDDLLDVTRITQGKVTLNKQDVFTHDLIRNVIRVCEEEINKKNIHVRTELEARNCHVFGDPARLQQILWNLLKNAVRFTKTEGQIIIRSDNDGESLRISVIDNGVGIERHNLLKLFRPFEQGDHTAGSISKGGLGLGLSIAKGFVEMHGGKIEAMSDGWYRGSTFTVTLPTVDPWRIGDKSTVQEPSFAIEPHEGARILLVEDHEDTRDAMAKLLGYAGYVVETAETVTDALQKASDNAYDLLVSDIGLPDGTGHELMRRMRSQNIQLKGIALTGFGQDDDVRRSHEVGFKHHVTKPVNLDMLSHVISQTLNEVS